MNKLFVIGLPRTGTTSVCAALLDEGFKVAHTAFSKHSFTLADVVADTPCYCDFQQLDGLFPGSKFINLERDMDSWLPSIQMLLKKISPYIQTDGKFNPILKRCYNQTFALSDTQGLPSEEQLKTCYTKHQQQIIQYFENRKDCISINISESNSYQQMLDFLGIEATNNKQFPHLNQGRMITEWKDLKHPNKINSDAYGPERRKFFDYAYLPSLP